MKRASLAPRRLRGLWRIGLLGAALVLPGLRAEAASNCSLVSFSGISFGAHDPSEARSVTQVGTVTLRCVQTGAAPALPVAIDLSAGNSGTYAVRQLRNGTHKLRYNLYLDAACTQTWGNGTGSSGHYILFPSASGETTLTIYGQILPGQSSTAGSYSDSISVTVNY
jgi:spore coat protein U-like protein